MELHQELDQKILDLDALITLKQQELFKVRQTTEQLVADINKLLGMHEAIQGILTLIDEENTK